MNSIKCKNCGLSNFAKAFQCQRCGSLFPRRAGVKRGLSVWSLLMIAVTLGLVYYFYNGVQTSMEEISANEAKRVAAQPTPRPGEAGLSRSQAEQRRTGTYADAVKNSSSLNAHQEHVNQTEKTMQQISNGQTPK